MAPPVKDRVEVQKVAEGSFNRMTPLYLPVTSTSFSDREFGRDSGLQLGVEVAFVGVLDVFPRSTHRSPRTT